MIRKSNSLSMAEAKEYLGKEEENMQGFIKKFTELSVEQAKDMRKKLEELNLMKLDDKKTSKIIDLLPSNSEELNKIFSDVGLDEDESNKIIEIVKQFK